MINEGINLPDKYDFHLANAGLGNRIASVLRAMLDGKPVAWVDEPVNNFSWTDFFENDPPCEMVHVKNRKIAIETMRLAGNGWAFPLENINRVVEEIKSWKPSEKVRDKMLDIPEGMIGYKVRLLSQGDKKTIKPFRVPDGCFLACDCAETLEMNKDNCIANMEGGMTHDNDRGSEHWLYAVADWFMLMQCEHIVEVIDSTFPTAHKICGIPFNPIRTQSQLEQVLACGLNKEKLRTIDASFEDKIDVFTYGQPGWGTPEEINAKLKKVASHLK